MKRDERRKASGRKNDSRGQRGYKGDTRRAERRAMPNRDRRENPNNKYEDNSAFDDGLQLEGRNPVLEALNHDKPIDKLFVKKGEIEGTLKVIVAKAREKGILVQEVDREVIIIRVLLLSVLLTNTVKYLIFLKLQERKAKTHSSLFVMKLLTHTI